MLIGLNGPMQSGKDTVFETMQALSEKPDSRLHKYIFKRDAFADRLKISAARALGVTGSVSDCLIFCNDLKRDGVKIYVENETIEPYSSILEITGREYLQRYGTEAHRAVFGEDFWINAVLPNLRDRHNYGRKDLRKMKNPVLVITDVRFPNEASAILSAGGEVWRVRRTEADVKASTSSHASERPLASIYVSREVTNDGGFDDLRKEVERVFPT